MPKLPEPEPEIEEEPQKEENEYFEASDNIKGKIEQLKEKSEPIDIPKKDNKSKPKRKYTMSKEREESLRKAREVSAANRRKRKEEKDNLQSIKNDNNDSYLKTQLEDYKLTLENIHNTNLELKKEIQELKNSKNKQSIPNHVDHYSNVNANGIKSYSDNQVKNPMNQSYTFEEMEYYANERYKQMKKQEEEISIKNKNNDIQKLRDRYLYGMR